MKKRDEISKITLPKYQLKLFGYDQYFNSFVKLFKKNKLPNTILLTGAKGLGKSTFAYHFINYILSYKDINKYSLENFTIHPENNSYKKLIQNIHPNFSLLETEKSSDIIKIDSVRNTLKFINKSTYASNIKIILIDNVEYLNAHSSNALLKTLEDVDSNTYFFLIYNNLSKILSTIKSRCVEFKISFNTTDKKKILYNIINYNNYNFDTKSIDERFFIDTPGNLLDYFLILENSNVNLSDDKKSIIFHLIDTYKQKNDNRILNFISLLIEFFYNELSLRNSKNLNIYSNNKSLLLKKINETKKFNLDKKNLIISLRDIIENETR
tara:strand:+ start:51 stop:1025 length:975 start_codon:yes stop_codon:yes gene_type:complete